MKNISNLNNFNFHNAVENQRYYNEEENKELLGMRSLWRAVITQALMDAASSSKKAYYIAEKAKARAWLKGDSDDFKEVCYLADMDPEYVKTQAKLAIARGCKWRNDFRGEHIFLDIKKHDNIYYGK